MKLFPSILTSIPYSPLSELNCDTLLTKIHKWTTVLIIWHLLPTRALKWDSREEIPLWYYLSRQNHQNHVTWLDIKLLHKEIQDNMDKTVKTFLSKGYHLLLMQQFLLVLLNPTVDLKRKIRTLILVLIFSSFLQPSST